MLKVVMKFQSTKGELCALANETLEMILFASLQDFIIFVIFVFFFFSLVLVYALRLLAMYHLITIFRCYCCCWLLASLLQGIRCK